MRSVVIKGLVGLSACLSLLTCVDPVDSTINASLNVLIVDATITDLAEPQLIRLNRSKADLFTGRFGYTPVTKAQVELVVDSVQVIGCTETSAGTYQLPTTFTGQVGHAYQLRFTLPEGTQYASSTEVLQPVAPIRRVRAQFNPNSLHAGERLNNSYAAAHDFYVDFTDPVSQANYYRWDWNDWERQQWCKSCNGGRYQINDPLGNLIEDCVNESITYVPFDYNCRTACWEIIASHSLVLFDDQVSNGQSVNALRVGQVPLYSKEHCLVEIRQTSLTPRAYAYFKQLSEQTQTTGGVASSTPALLVGNVTNLVQEREPVVGYFSVSSVYSYRYWLTRSDATGFTPGLFQALNGHDPRNEPSSGRDRPPLAVCAPSASRTPDKPPGWQD